jgi:hypothetical protein
VEIDCGNSCAPPALTAASSVKWRLDGVLPLNLATRPHHIKTGLSLHISLPELKRLHSRNIVYRKASMLSFRSICLVVGEISIHITNSLTFHEADR